MRAALAVLISIIMTGAAHGAGAYVSQPARDGAACAQLCADDGLCVAWSFENGACALRATAPDAAEGWHLSARAPASLRQTFVNQTPAPADPVAPPPPRESPAAQEEAPAFAEANDGTGLLGGPVMSASASPSLRLELRN